MPGSSASVVFGRPFVCAALIALATAAAPCMSWAAPPPGYTLVWRDEFHRAVGQTPDPAIWGYDTGKSGWGNHELEEYVSDAAHAHVVADRAATDGRALRIQVTSAGPGEYRSARLLTRGKLTVQYGYIEARIRLPYGQGIWPAFWLLGSDIDTVGWPRCGEMDVMENIGKQSWWGRNLGSFHGPGYSGGNALNGPYDLPDGRYFKDGYHTFGLLWSKDSASYYVDGNRYETRTPADTRGNPWAFNHPFFLLLNVAVGGDFPGSPDGTTVFPQSMLIDYVRVYQDPRDHGSRIWRASPSVGARAAGQSDHNSRTAVAN